jgi:hypothetical protein
MSEFLVRPVLAWYDWALFVLLFAGVGMAALVIYDSRGSRRPALGWIAATLLPILALLPSLLLTLRHPDLDPLILALGAAGSLPAAMDVDTSASLSAGPARQLVPYFVLGLVGGLLPIASGALYLFTGPKPRTVDQEAGATRLPAQDGVPAEGEEMPSSPRPRINAWLAEVDTGRSYQLFQGNTRLGRSPAANDIVFSDPTVSREHALIRQEGQTFTLFDRGSRTGTFVGEQRVERPVLLVHGDVIVLGEIALTFTAPE